jgi:peroxin-12
MDFFHEYGGDPLKPSLFELVAQEQLRDLLQPALKYVLSVRLVTIQSIERWVDPILQVFAQRYPRYLLRIVNRHEEFYALIMLYVERHYLHKYSMCSLESLLDVFTYVRQIPPLQRTSMALNAGGDRTPRRRELGPLLGAFLSKRN